MVRSLCVSCIFATAAGKICVTDADYDGTVTLTIETYTLTCDQMVAGNSYLQDFAGTKEACFTMQTSPEDGSKYPSAAVVGQMQPCCGSGVQVCAQYVVNPCVTASDLNDAAMVGEITCGAQRAGVPDFNSAEPTLEECAEEITLGDSTMSKLMLMTYMAPCCGNKPTKCANYAVNPCKTASKFDEAADSKMDDDEVLPCGMAAAYMPPFTPSKEACEKEEKISDKTKTRGEWMEELAGNCCGDDVVDVCKEFMATTAKNNDSDASSTVAAKNNDSDASSTVAMHAAGGAAMVIAAIAVV